VLPRGLEGGPVIAVAFVAIVVVLAIGAPLLSPYDPARQTLETRLRPPSLDHLFGTDALGRDVLSRVIYGSRVSLAVAGLSISLAAVVGVSFGLLAGYFRGVLDTVVMRAMDGLLGLPPIFLAIAFVGAFGAGLVPLIIAIAVVVIPRFARLARASTLTIRRLEYVTAAQAIGVPPLAVLRRHIFPNTLSPLIVVAALSISEAIVLEASLSFLGLGVQPPTPSWGTDLRNGRQFLESATWLVIAPGVGVAATVLAINTIGDAVRDRLDPRSSRASVT
jgi:peptide/nickel transport system permease protein